MGHPQSKPCSVCGEDKPLGAFGPQPHGKYGRRAACNQCRKIEHRDYYERHREQVLTRCAEYRAEHPDRVSDIQARSYAAHRKVRSRQRSQWRKQNPDACRARTMSANARRRARRASATGSFTQADVDAQYKRQRGRCYWCGERVGRKYHVDHVVPLSRGGGNGPENLVISCATCNVRKNDRLPHEMAWRLC